MIASDPSVQPTYRDPTFVDMVTRELEKLYYKGRISHPDYFKAADLARGQKKVLNYIYSGGANGVQQAVLFLLRQVRSKRK